MKLWGERYQILRELGSGGMGRVYQAQDLREGRTVAIKELRLAPEMDRVEALARFRREGRNQARIDHPHLVSLLDVGLPEDGNPYLVMELVDGVDLDTRLRSGGAVSLEFAQRILDEVGGALDALHQEGILHRDLKPANIMLRRPGGEAVVMDLGLARAQGDTLLTRTGALLGTPFYMAPEVILGGAWTPASDLFQLGAILFEMLAGYRLVEARQMEHLLAALATGAWRPFPSDRLDLTPEIRAVVLASISVDPKARFSSGAALATAFRDALAVPGAAGSSRISWGVAALAGVALSGGLAFGLSPGKPPIAPSHVRFRVARDHLAVHFRPRGATGLALVVGGQTIPLKESPRPDQETVLRYSGLPPDGQEARLIWQGGEGMSFLARPNPLAISDSCQLVPGHWLRLEVRRPVTTVLASGQVLLLYPGTRFLPSPPLLEPSHVLSWGENGFSFQSKLDVIRLQQSLVEKMRTDVAGGDVEGVLAAQGPSREQLRAEVPWPPFEDGFEAERKKLRRYSEWIPDLLQGPLPPETRSEIWTLWQTWGQSVVQERLLGGKPTPLEISRGLPGSRWSGKSGDQPLELDTSRGRAVWKPESIPPGARKFHLSLRVENLSQWVRVHLELGPGGQDILFWHPRPVARKVSHEFTGWLTVSLPLSLAPAPGSELSLELERLFPSSPVSGKLLELRVAFPSGS